MWPIGFLASLIVLAQNAHAVDPTLILGEESPVQGQVAPAVPAAAPAEPGAQPVEGAAPIAAPAIKREEPALPEVSLQKAKQQKPIQFTLRPGWATRTYKLSSQGLSGSFPNGGGFSGDLLISRETIEGQRMIGSFGYGTNTFSNIPGITPTGFTITSLNAYLEYQWLAGGEASPRTSSWWFGAGWQFKKRGGAVALPITPVTEVMFQGIRFGFAYEGPHLMGSVGLDLSSHVMIPVFFREDIDQTGSYRFGLTSENTIFLRYELRDALTLAIGATFVFDYRGYSGVGTRSTLNATELETLITVPLELRVRF